MNYCYEYGRNLLISNIIKLYQEFEGKFTEEQIEHWTDVLSLKNDNELFIEYGFCYELVYDK